VPGIFERHERLVDATLSVDSEDAVECMERLAEHYGLFVGPSSGANLIATRSSQEACAVGYDALYLMFLNLVGELIRRRGKSFDGHV
jgi:cysteine synthase